MLTKNACLLNRIFSHSVDAFYSSEKKTLRQYRMVKSVVCLYVMCLLVCADTFIGQIPKGTTEKKREMWYIFIQHHTAVSLHKSFFIQNPHTF